MVRFLASLCCQRLEDWQKFDEGKPSILKPKGKKGAYFCLCAFFEATAVLCISYFYPAVLWFFFSITKLGFEVVEKPLASCSFVQ